MTVKRFFATAFLAAGLVLTTAPAALAADPAPLAIASDPAKLRAAEGIMTNLKLYDLMVSAGQKALAENPDAASYTPAQKTQLAQAFADAMAKRRTSIVHKLAAGCRGDYTTDQLNNLTALSKVKYVQDLIFQGADPSHVADAGSMTVAEQTLLQKIGNETYVNAFFAQALDLTVVKDDVTDARQEAFAAVKPAN